MVKLIAKFVKVGLQYLIKNGEVDFDVKNKTVRVKFKKKF